jgi:hypothetical protein
VSSPRNDRFRAECQGKVRFRSPERARGTLSKYRNERDAPDMHTYRCSFCGSWHLGHVPAEPQRNRRARLTRRFA